MPVRRHFVETENVRRKLARVTQGRRSFRTRGLRRGIARHLPAFRSIEGLGEDPLAADGHDAEPGVETSDRLDGCAAAARRGVLGNELGEAEVRGLRRSAAGETERGEKGQLPDAEHAG